MRIIPKEGPPANQKQGVTVKDLEEGLARWLVPCFEEVSSLTSVTCSSGKKKAIISGFKELGFQKVHELKGMEEFLK